MFVYKITHIASGLVYIGKASDPKRRWQQHCGSGKNSSKWLHAAIKKHGVDAFSFEVVGAHATEEEAYAAEEEMIRQLRSDEREHGYNLAPGGRGGAGKMPKSPEHRAKIGAAHLGQKRSPEQVAKMRLAPQTAEKRAKISAAKLGKKRGPTPREVVEKIAAANRGRTHGPEFGAKISAARRGMKASEETKRKLSEARRGKKRAPFSDEAMANLARAGLTRRGRKLSPEHLAKLTGRKLSDEHRAALSSAQKTSERTSAQIEKLAEINRGKKRSPEACEATASALRGRTKTPEHRAALSAAKRGKPGKAWTPEQRAKVAAYWARKKEES